MRDAAHLLHTLILNAGGDSLRMGQPKALLAVPTPAPAPAPTPAPARSLIIHIAARLQPLAPTQTFVVANAAVAHGLRAWRQAVPDDDAPDDFALLPDREPPAGPLGGLAMGLARCKGWAALVACDMPLVNPALFEELLREVGEQPAEGLDAVVPVVAGRAQPLHALYHRRCLPAIETRLQAGERRMDAFFADVNVRYVDEEQLRSIEPTLQSFTNVNTPQAWRGALALLEQESAR